MSFKTKQKRHINFFAQRIPFFSFFNFFFSAHNKKKVFFEHTSRFLFESLI